MLKQIKEQISALTAVLQLKAKGTDELLAARVEALEKSAPPTMLADDKSYAGCQGDCPEGYANTKAAQTEDDKSFEDWYSKPIL